jgi:hypothetical protein
MMALHLPDKAPMASIADLKDIPPPAPVSYMPQTVGWWVVAAVIVLGALVLAFFKWRAWERNRYRREAQAELMAIESAVADPARRADALAAIPALVKRTVLAWAPRQVVAPMSGDAWLRYLDRTYARGGFAQGPGRALGALAYGGSAIENDELTALLNLLHRWIDHHVAA